jgi:hypothetical protein
MKKLWLNSTRNRNPWVRFRIGYYLFRRRVREKLVGYKVGYKVGRNVFYPSFRFRNSAIIYLLTGRGVVSEERALFEGILDMAFRVIWEEDK